MSFPRGRLLFVCTANRLRSPTAEALFTHHPEFVARSAGLDSKAAVCPLTAEQAEWADLIFVFEPRHQREILERFPAECKRKDVICLHIPDEYERMDPELVKLIQEGTHSHLEDYKESCIDLFEIDGTVRKWT